MLLYFSRRGALPLGKIGERLQVHRTSVTNIVDGSSADGLVRRVPPRADRRTTLAEITDAGPRHGRGGDRGAEPSAFGMRSADAARPRAADDDPPGMRLDAGDFTRDLSPDMRNSDYRTHDDTRHPHRPRTYDEWRAGLRARRRSAT